MLLIEKKKQHNIWSFLLFCSVLSSSLYAQPQPNNNADNSHTRKNKDIIFSSSSPFLLVDKASYKTVKDGELIIELCEKKVEKKKIIFYFVRIKNIRGCERNNKATVVYDWTKDDDDDTIHTQMRRVKNDVRQKWKKFDCQPNKERKKKIEAKQAKKGRTGGQCVKNRWLSLCSHCKNRSLGSSDS